jgi:hypothetical protein
MNKVTGAERFFQIHEWGRVAPLNTRATIVEWENPDEGTEVFFIDTLGNNWTDGVIVFLTIDDQTEQFFASLGELNNHREFHPPLMCKRNFKYEIYNGSLDPEFLFEIQAVGRMKRVG